MFASTRKSSRASRMSVASISSTGFQKRGRSTKSSSRCRVHSTTQRRFVLRIPFGAYTDNATGEFSHCAVNARYKSGVALFFSVTRDRQWSMGFANSHWNLSPGNRYPVRFQVDRGPILKSTATAKTQKMVQVHLPAKNRLFRHFKVGGMLKVAAGSKVMRFNLTGTPNKTYTIEASANLTNWVNVGTLTYTNGLMPFVDTGAGALTNRFYRAR